MTRASRGRELYLRVVIGLLKLYFGLYHRLRADGTANIPPSGPLFVIVNHVSLLDPLAAGTYLFDYGYRFGANTWTVTKQELFQIPLLAWLLRSIGMFPLDRARFDSNAMRKMLQVLKAGDVIAIAPEGTRSPTGQLQAFQPVVAKLAISRHVPILPVGAIGTHEALPIGSKFPRPKQITLHYGPVFELSEFYDRQLSDSDLDRAAGVMRDHVAQLLPEWMRVPPPPELVRHPGGGQDMTGACRGRASAKEAVQEVTRTASFFMQSCTESNARAFSSRLAVRQRRAGTAWHEFRADACREVDRTT